MAIYLEETLTPPCSNFRFFNSIVPYMSRNIIIICIIIVPINVINIPPSILDAVEGWRRLQCIPAYTG